MLHLLILLFFVKNFQEFTFLPPHTQEKKISLNISQFVPPPAPKPIVTPPKPKPVPQPIVTPPIPKPIVKKEKTPEPEVKPIKKKILDKSKKVFAEKSTEENNVTKAEPKPKKKIVKKEKKKKPAKKVVKKKRVAKKTKPQKKRKRSNDVLFNALMGAANSTSVYPKKQRSSSSNYASKMIKQLYGKEFNTFSQTQKKFIKNNLGTIHRITQRTLTFNGYPDVAVRTKQQGTNVVSFYLHPNGDITGLKLKRHIGYASLDQNTLEVIRIAYKNYPLPNKKTKIMFYVTYSLY